MSLEGLKFIQANLDHTRMATSHVIDFIQNQSIHFAIIGDPYVRAGNVPGLPHSVMTFAYPYNPKVLLLVQSVPFDPFPIHISEYVVAVRFSSQVFSFLLVAVYAAPSLPVTDILDPCSQLIMANHCSHVIIAGDFNAKSPRWGGQVTDSRGAAVTQFLVANDFDVANDPASLPTFVTDYAEAWIDLTLFSSAWRDFSVRWRVSETPSLSDHRYVVFSVGSHRLPTCKRLTRAGRSRVMASLARNRWFAQVARSEIADPVSLDLIVDHFYDLYGTLCRENVQTARLYPQAKPWWSDDIARQRSQVRSLRRSFQRSRDPAERLVRRDVYYSALQKYRCAIAQAKDASVRKFCTDNTEKFLFGDPFKLAFGKFRTPITLPPLDTSDGLRTTSQLESARVLLSAHMPRDDASTDDPVHAAERALAETPYFSNLRDTPFTVTEVRETVRSMRVRSAPGLDGLTPELVQAFHEAHPAFVCFVFNAALRLGHFPTAWKVGRVVFIPKPGRSPENPRSYRPICMLSVFGKVLEKLLFSRLYYFLNSHNLIHPLQFGFTHNKNTTMALHHLREVLQSRRRDLLHSVLISLDFQGAFDSVWHPTVLNFLRRHSCPVNLYCLLRSFLCNRRVVCRLKEGDASVEQSIGSPQGSPLSPLLWNIVLHELLETTFPPGVHVQAYADDTLLVVSGRHRRELERLAADALAVVCEWAESVKVRLNASKCSFMLFPNGRVSLARRLPTIRLDGVNLSMVKEMKVLGVVLDPWFTCMAHTTYLKTKVDILVPKLVQFIHMHYRLPPSAFRRLYLQLIQPAITYASPAWWPESPSNLLVNRIKSLQRIPLLVLTGAVRTVRTEALNALTGIPPLAEVLAAQRAQFLLVSLRREVTYGRLSLSPDRVQRTFDPWRRHPASRVVCPFRRLETPQALAYARLPGLHVYTDGAFSNSLAGAAFVVYTHTGRLVEARRFKVSSAGSAFAAELIALREALVYLTGCTTERPVRVYTDCLSLLSALASLRTRNEGIEDIRALFSVLSTRMRLFLFHVRGHARIPGNEIADHLAVRACTVGEPRESALSVRVVRSMLDAEVWRAWSVQWTTVHTDTELFRWIPAVRSLPPNFPPHRRVIFFITGHGRFPFYLYYLSLVPHPLCFCGSECWNIEHYMSDCSETAQFRQRLQDLLHTDLTPLLYPALLRNQRALDIIKEMVEFINLYMPSTD